MKNEVVFPDILKPYYRLPLLIDPGFGIVDSKGMQVAQFASYEPCGFKEHLKNALAGDLKPLTKGRFYSNLQGKIIYTDEAAETSFNFLLMRGVDWLTSKGDFNLNYIQAYLVQKKMSVYLAELLNNHS